METLLATVDVRVVRTPAAAPNRNAHAERFVRSIKAECLERVVPLGERHLRQLVREFVAHYHSERNHQGIGNALIDRPLMQRTRGPVHRRQRVGGGPQLLLPVGRVANGRYLHGHSPLSRASLSPFEAERDRLTGQRL